MGYSKRRVDSKYKTFENLSSAFVHSGWQSIYNNERCINVYIRTKGQKSGVQRQINKEARDVDFQNNCLFCGRTFHNTSTEKLRSVDSIDTTQKILQNIEKLNKIDDASKSILARSKNMPNLRQLKARYHAACMATF